MDRLALLRDRAVRNAFASALPARRVGRTIEYHDVIATTMTRGEELVRAGTPDGTVVVADHQTAGRGRRGRTWGYGGPGTQLLASWLLVVDEAAAPFVTLLSSVALLRAVRDLGAEDLSVKWPNDLLLRGRKVAGVLAAGVRDEGGRHWLVLGTGVDTHGRDHPEAERTQVTSFAREGYDLDRLVLLSRLAPELERLVDGDDASRREVLADWRRWSATLGRRVRVDDGTRAFDGDAVDVDEEGALLVRRDGVTERILAGDVCVRTT